MTRTRKTAAKPAAKAVEEEAKAAPAPDATEQADAKPETAADPAPEVEAQPAEAAPAPEPEASAGAEAEPEAPVKVAPQLFVEVVGPRKGLRRAGRRWGPEATRVREDELTADQKAQLLAEPKLIVNVVEG